MKNQYSKLRYFSVLITLSLIIFQACVKEKIDITKTGNNSISPQYAGALVHSNLTMKDILRKTNQNGQLVDSSGFLILVYKGNLFSLPASQLVNIPTQSPVSGSYSLSNADAAAINALPANSTFTVKDSSLVNFTAGGGTQINTLNCNTASLAISLSYGITHTSTITITIPAATLGGVPFIQTIPINYTGSSPVVVNQNYFLNGYSIDMTNHGTTHNALTIYYSIAILKDANPTNPGDAVNFTETFSNVTYNSIIGYVGQQFLTPNTDTVPVTIFQSNIFNSGTTFNLVRPLIKVFLSNSFGLPIHANFNTFDGYTPGQPLIPITGAPNPIPIPTPSVIGQTAKDSFILSKTNSNVIGLVNNFPKNVIYNVNSQSNPAGPVYTNFITDTSLFKVDLELDLPLYGNVSNYMFQDTVKYSFDLNTDNVKSISVRAYIKNGFPINVGMSINFVDSSYHLIDSLISHPNQLVMPSASINTSTGMVTSSTTNTADFTIPSSVIPQLNKVKYILIGAVANTSHNGTTPPTNVKIYDFYTLEVDLGVNVQLNVKF